MFNNCDTESEAVCDILCADPDTHGIHNPVDVVHHDGAAQTVDEARLVRAGDGGSCTVHSVNESPRFYGRGEFLCILPCASGTSRPFQDAHSLILGYDLNLRGYPLTQSSHVRNHPDHPSFTPDFAQCLKRSVQ